VLLDEVIREVRDEIGEVEMSGARIDNEGRRCRSSDYELRKI
jgi:hypothetical protein